jgi:hypothetical protein
MHVCRVPRLSAVCCHDAVVCRGWVADVGGWPTLNRQPPLHCHGMACCAALVCACAVCMCTLCATPLQPANISDSDLTHASPHLSTLTLIFLVVVVV